MQDFESQVYEIFITADGAPGVVIPAPDNLSLAPGQYLAAWSPEEAAAPLSETFFPIERSGGLLRLVGQAQPSWRPGARLLARGPLGRPFELPSGARRLALAGLAGSINRLLPLAHSMLGAAVTVFCDPPLPRLPLEWEAYPLEELPAGLAWADFAALEVPVGALPALRARLISSADGRLPCPGQALVLAPMPCAGLGTCGACAAPAGGDWQLVCEAGPVFDLQDLITTRR